MFNLYEICLILLYYMHISAALKATAFSVKCFTLSVKQFHHFYMEGCCNSLGFKFLYNLCVVMICCDHKTLF